MKFASMITLALSLFASGSALANGCTAVANIYINAGYSCVSTQWGPNGRYAYSCGGGGSNFILEPYGTSCRATPIR